MINLDVNFKQEGTIVIRFHLSNKWNTSMEMKLRIHIHVRMKKLCNIYR